MQKNPCYEDSTLPVYEEVQLPNRAELTDARVKLTERSASNIADNTNAEASIKKKTNWKAKCIGLVFSLSLLAFAMVIAIASSVYVSSNQGMDSLMKENQELMMQLNKTKMDIAKLKDDFTRIETDGFMENMAQLVNLLSSINALNITDNDFMAAFYSLQSSVSSLNTTNAATMIQLNSLQSLVSSLTTRVNSPVNLYQNCIQETRSCTIGPRAIDTYWTWCQTAFEPITKTGYYTTDIRCEYEAPTTDGIQETHILRKLGQNIQCQCHLSVLGGSQHAAIQSFVSMCSLVITRCPS